MPLPPPRTARIACPCSPPKPQASASCSAAKRGGQPQRSESGFGDHFAASLVGHLRRHVALVMLGEDIVGNEQAARVKPALGDHAASFLNRSGVMPRKTTGVSALLSLTVKRMVRPSASRRSEPLTTIPPSRIALSGVVLPAAMSDGVTK